MRRSVLQKCKLLVILLIKSILGIVPKDKDLILFSAWNGQRYADSSMYLFEYLLHREKHKAFWYTKNKSLFHELKTKEVPVVYSRSLKGIWMQIRAIMLVSSIQLGDFNPYLLKNCIYFDLGHGFPIKESGFEQPDCTQYFIKYTMTVRQSIQYYMLASSEFTKNITCRAFRMAPSHVAFCGFPRIDVFFDPLLRVGVNDSLKDIIKGKTVISYLPTHRAMGKEPVNCDKVFCLQDIQTICEKHNAVFLIKKHFFHVKEIEDVSMFSRIVDITPYIVETQTLLFDTDILVTDYSACAIDYVVLDRPIIFHAYDLELFLERERNLYVPFESNHAGYKTYTASDFSAALDKILTQGNDDEHSFGREELKRRYFDGDCPIGCSRDELSRIIDKMISKSYHSKWEDSK